MNIKPPPKGPITIYIRRTIVESRGGPVMGWQAGFTPEKDGISGKDREGVLSIVKAAAAAYFPGRAIEVVDE